MHGCTKTVVPCVACELWLIMSTWPVMQRMLNHSHGEVSCIITVSYCATWFEYSHSGDNDSFRLLLLDDPAEAARLSETSVLIRGVISTKTETCLFIFLIIFKTEM